MAENETAQEGKTKAIRPQKIYIKDVSFETPNSPEIFRKKWDPTIEVEFQNSAREIEKNLYEVVITLTVTTSVAGELAYLAEVQQAGIFTIQGLDPNELHQNQNVYCVNILYPYASAAVSDLVTRGGFPQQMLGPLNFQKLYVDRINLLREKAAAEGKQPDPLQA